MHVTGCRLSLSTVLLATAAIAWLGHSAGSAMAALPGPCADRGTGGEVVLCDEFEGGSLRARWEDSLPAIWPAAFVFCADAFGFGDRCAAWSAARAVFAPLPELYVRWYQFIPARQPAGTPPDMSVMLGDPSGSVTIAAATGVRRDGQHITFEPGRWYLFEWHVKLNSPGVADGLSELWIDDARGPIATQTLRLRHREAQWLAPADAGKLLGTVSLVARGCDDVSRACPGGEATSPYQSHRWDHIVVSRSPIGPLVVGRLPRAPTGLRIGS
jgi:hypothetical protein